MASTEETPAPSNTTKNIVRYLMEKHGSNNNNNNSFTLSRKSIHELIAAGAVKINDRVLLPGDAATPGAYVTEGVDVVHFDESAALKTLKDNVKVFVCLKPVGVETTMSANVRNSLYSALKDNELVGADVVGGLLFPVGRLDFDSCGMLILTNSGALAERLTNPSFLHEKEYLVQTSVSELPDDFFVTLRNGGVSWNTSSSNKAKKKNKKNGGAAEIATETTETSLPCRVERVDSSDVPVPGDIAGVLQPRGTGAMFRITLTQGLNRQIRHMTEAATPKANSTKVTFLKRYRVGPLCLAQFDGVLTMQNPVAAVVGGRRDEFLEWAFAGAGADSGGGADAVRRRQRGD